MDAGEVCAGIECPIVDGGYADWDEGALAADNQPSVCRRDDGVAAVAGVIDRVGAVNVYGRER